MSGSGPDPVTNRQRLERAARDIVAVQADPAVGPSGCSALAAALDGIRRACRWPLDADELDELRHG